MIAKFRKATLVLLLLVWTMLTVWGAITIDDLQSRLGQMEDNYYTFSATVLSALGSYTATLESSTSRQSGLENIIISTDCLHETVEHLRNFNAKHAPASLSETAAIKATWKKSVGGE